MKVRHYWLKDCWVVTDNRLHLAAPGRGRRAFLYTPAAVKSWQEIITNAFREIDQRHGFPALTENMGYHVLIQAVFPIDVYGYPKSKKLRQKDASNIIKALQDCLFTHLGVDDRYAVQTTAAKYAGSVEKIQVLITVTEVPLWTNPEFVLEEHQDRSADVSVTYELADRIMGKASKDRPSKPHQPQSRRKRAMKKISPIGDEELKGILKRSLKSLTEGKR